MTIRSTESRFSLLGLQYVLLMMFWEIHGLAIGFVVLGVSKVAYHFSVSLF
jgi:hypothetical protein